MLQQMRFFSITIGICAVLQQNGHPIAFVTNALGTKHQQLPTSEKKCLAFFSTEKCLAILIAMEHWAHISTVKFFFHS